LVHKIIIKLKYTTMLESWLRNYRLCRAYKGMSFFETKDRWYFTELSRQVYLWTTAIPLLPIVPTYHKMQAMWMHQWTIWFPSIEKIKTLWPHYLYHWKSRRNERGIKNWKRKCYKKLYVFPSTTNRNSDTYE